MSETMDHRRARSLNDVLPGPGPVVYWMHRDQRVEDNWALLQARELAAARGAPLLVAFCLLPQFLGAGLRQYGFMLRGLARLARELAARNMGFCLLRGQPQQELPRFCREREAGAVVTDFSPLRLNRQWKKDLARELGVALLEVDAHNIVPCWEASSKQEYMAHTLRRKMNRLLPQYLGEIPPLEALPPAAAAAEPEPPWEEAWQGLEADRQVPEVDWCQPGEEAARRARDEFLARGLARYHLARNDPVQDGQSGLSPYLHFGMLGAQRLALEVLKSEAPEEARQSFLEELIVRRELADNYCYYQPYYDGVEGFPRWARETLEAHAADRREYVYTREELEAARTHDPLWNAAQAEMARRGKMHGYLRMYWAKKILEWSESPARAQADALYLNDRYQLDGRDPNGYVGVAWSVGGVHDRPWPERPVLGKVRYMNLRGARRKFDVDGYIQRVNPAFPG